jgi:hypothetical protein
MKDVMRGKTFTSHDSFRQLSSSGVGMPPKNGLLCKYGNCRNDGNDDIGGEYL